MTQSVLEGVAFALRDNLSALNEAGTELTQIMAVGGGSSSDYWLSLLASVLGLPIDRPESGDFGAAFGAARLAMASVNECNGIDIMHTPNVAQSFEPILELQNPFDDAYQAYRNLYPAIKGIQT